MQRIRPEEDIYRTFDNRGCPDPAKMLYPGQTCAMAPTVTAPVLPVHAPTPIHPMMLLAAAQAPPTPSSPPPPPVMYGVSAALINEAIWKEFDALGTEMIITKTGRRMFPHLRFRLSGLQLNRHYIVLLELVLADKARHKYSQEGRSGEDGAKGGWRAAGAADIQAAFSARAVFHPRSPALGSAWMEKDISFVHAKMTNNARAPNGNILLSSMHKYYPRIRVVETTDISAVMHSPTATFEFEHTSFIAVTAYQNPKIIELKIKKNPFAKGFREEGRARHKRKLNQSKDPPTEDATVAGIVSSLEPSSSPANQSMDDDAVSTSSGFASSYGSGVSSPEVDNRSPEAFDYQDADEATSQDKADGKIPDSPPEPKRSCNLGLLSIDNILSRPDPPPRRYCYQSFPEEVNHPLCHFMSMPNPPVSPQYWFPEGLTDYSVLPESAAMRHWQGTAAHYRYLGQALSPMVPVIQPAPLDYSVRRYRF